MMSQLRIELEEKRAVVLPTETVYGLFAKALDEEAVDYVYQLTLLFAFRIIVKGPGKKAS